MLGLLVLYFVLGFLLYAALYAAAGALVSRQEEVANSTGPLTFLVMAGYLISFYASLNPSADWVIPVSYIPFFTPMMMLAREGVTPLPWWEITISTVVMIVAIFVCTWGAARIYRIGILMYGQKPGFSAFFQYMRSRPKGAA
jgi:ABC-2 type transport system permease protein